MGAAGSATALPLAARGVLASSWRGWGRRDGNGVLWRGHQKDWALSLREGRKEGTFQQTGLRDGEEEEVKNRFAQRASWGAGQGQEGVHRLASVLLLMCDHCPVRGALRSSHSIRWGLRPLRPMAQDIACWGSNTDPGPGLESRWVTWVV